MLSLSPLSPLSFVELIVVGFAVIEMSLIVTVTVAAWDRAPLVPVTVTV